MQSNPTMAVNYCTCSEHQRLREFIASLLDPEQYGWAVSAEVRQTAREALGRKPTTEKPE